VEHPLPALSVGFLHTTTPAVVAALLAGVAGVAGVAAGVTGVTGVAVEE